MKKFALVATCCFSLFAFAAPGCDGKGESTVVEAPEVDDDSDDVSNIMGEDAYSESMEKSMNQQGE